MGSLDERDAERLRDELSRAIAHRVSLQEALATVEAERNVLLVEEAKLRAAVTSYHAALEELSNRNADVHGALNVSEAEKRQLEGALEAVVAVSRGLDAKAPAQPEGEARPQAGPEPAETGEKPALEEEPKVEQKPKVEPRPAEKQPSPPLRVVAGPPAIEVETLTKVYDLPLRPVDTLKEQLLHPLRSRRSAELRALDGITFDVHRGEFFGIAGANGSGKSTLLKVLANVYAADSGTVRTAGQVAPFIELGVGLNPDLAAFDNVVISGVMMGLTPDRARELYPEIIEFAGLERFTAVKLKNYSSGMRVRLAFSVMAQVDADILLIDEVLAVGDAEFREKCLTRLRQLRDAGKTIVLVTHGMETITKECDRGMLLRHGSIVFEGDPTEVARRYFAEQAGKAEDEEAGDDGVPLRLVEQ